MPKDFRDTKQNRKKMERIRKQQSKKGTKWQYGLTHAKLRIGGKADSRGKFQTSGVKVIFSKSEGIDLREENGIPKE